MSYHKFYDLLKKYDGDLYKASQEEVLKAAGNCSHPHASLTTALQIWKKKNEGNPVALCYDKMGTCDGEECHCNVPEDLIVSAEKNIIQEKSHGEK
jgi:hypothetical protein